MTALALNFSSPAIAVQTLRSQHRALGAWSTAYVGTRAPLPLVLLLSYLVHGLAQSMDVLRPAREVSPYCLLFGNEPLSHGLDIGIDIGVLVLMTCVIMLGLSSVLLSRRDLA